MTKKPRKGDFRELKSKTFSRGGACPRTPLEACAFGSRLGNRSILILDPRLKSNQQCQHTNLGGGGGGGRKPPGLLTGHPSTPPPPPPPPPPPTTRRGLLTGLPSTPSSLTLTDLCTTIRANWTSHRSPANAYTAS